MSRPTSAIGCSLTGIVLTRVDGDARGGAALSMRAVTGKPIKFIGVGEKLDALEDFHPDRIAGRILGMGDIVSLVERAAETIEREQAEKLAARMQKGQFDLERHGRAAEAAAEDGRPRRRARHAARASARSRSSSKAPRSTRSLLRRQQAIISSMTPRSAAGPSSSRPRASSASPRGAGSTVQEINKLLKQHMEMARMVKQVGKLGDRRG